MLAPEMKFEVDSAGTHDYHIGSPPDVRSQRAAQRRGIDMSQLRARRLVVEDFERFDWIVVMDERNRLDALALAHPDSPAQLVRLLDFAPGQALRDVPDPYYGKAADFAQVVDAHRRRHPWPDHGPACAARRRALISTCADCS